MTFEQAYPAIRRHEGKYVNDPDDAGGETFWGITRRSHPTWPGWVRVDKAKAAGHRTAKALDAYFKDDQAMADMVAERTRLDYWEPLWGIPDKIRTKLVDICVNMGLSGGVMVLQRTLNQLGAKLRVDGALGPATRGALEGRDEDKVIDVLCEVQATRYRELAEKRPENKKYLKGWLIRAKWRP
ncbi:MAG: hypothetical protein LBT47_00975 [Deltaproteobacteria bacterium]|jgi:lysozyme family protein|nr:hypothetical protein [Deltaproteobacteria bacterium]